MRFDRSKKLPGALTRELVITSESERGLLTACRINLSVRSLQ